jgi:hypothetical protein
MPKLQSTSGGSYDGVLSSPELNSSRRQFLLKAGTVGIIASGLASCNKIWDHVHKPGDKNDTVDLGTGDTGILNYCYLLQQLEAAFYTKVIQSPFEGIREDETAKFISLYNHEIAHREFYKKLLGTNAIIDLHFNFKTIEFGDRAVVLQTAKTFEDLVAAAYTGIADKIVEQRFLFDNSKVVSVDSRHAAAVANLQQAGSFADTVTINGTEPRWTPSQTMAVAQLYIVNKVDFSGISF